MTEGKLKVKGYLLGPTGESGQKVNKKGEIRKGYLLGPIGESGKKENKKGEIRKESEKEEREKEKGFYI